MNGAQLERYGKKTKRRIYSPGGHGMTMPPKKSGGMRDTPAYATSNAREGKSRGEAWEVKGMKTYHSDPPDLVVDLHRSVVGAAISGVVRPEESIPDDYARRGLAVQDEGRPPRNEGGAAHLGFERQGRVEEARRRAEGHPISADEGHGGVGVVLVDDVQVSGGVEFKELDGHDLDHRVRGGLEGPDRLRDGGVGGVGGVDDGRRREGDVRLREAEAPADAGVQRDVVVVARLIKRDDERHFGGGARAHGRVRRGVVLRVARPCY